MGYTQASYTWHVFVTVVLWKFDSNEKYEYMRYWDTPYGFLKYKPCFPIEITSIYVDFHGHPMCGLLQQLV